MDRIEVMLKEYEMLRQEILGAMSNRAQIISFGLGTIGVLFAGILTSDLAKESPKLLIVVFSFAIPTASVLVLYIWLGEVERMMRAGRYLANLEGRINRALGAGEDTLRWENWLRDTRVQIRYTYLVVIALFFGFAYGSPVLTVLAGKLAFRSHAWVVLLPWAAGVPILCDVYRRTSRFR